MVSIASRAFGACAIGFVARSADAGPTTSGFRSGGIDMFEEPTTSAEKDALWMIHSARSTRSDQSYSFGRRSLLGFLATAPLGLFGTLLAACSDSIPPRQYKPPPSYIVRQSDHR
jgi:hypothetical protein